jgi:gas vesicle structural protein
MALGEEPAAVACQAEVPSTMSEPNPTFDDSLAVDAYVQLSLLGLNLITIDARVVSTNVSTSLRIAEAAGRREQEGQRRGLRQRGLPEMLSQLIEAGARGEGGGRASVAAPEEALSRREPGRSTERGDGEAREHRPPLFGARAAAAPRRAPSHRRPLRQDPSELRRSGPP